MSFWLLIVTDPHGEEITLCSTEAKAKLAKCQCMELWLREDLRSMKVDRHRSIEHIVDPDEAYLADCDIRFRILELDVDDERYSRLLASTQRSRFIPPPDLRRPR